MSPAPGQNHLVRDERRQASEDAACSTAPVGEESPLQPASAPGARSTRSVRSAAAAGSALADDSSAATERSVDAEPDCNGIEAAEDAASECLVLASVC